MTTLLADQAIAGAGLHEMAESVKSPAIVLIEAMENALKIAFFMTSRNGVGIQISSNCE